MADRRNKEERRAGKDRRRKRIRRRNSSERVAVIEITGDILRAAILDRSETDGTDEVQAVSIDWRKNAAALNCDEGIRELTQALTSLSEEFSLQTASVHFVLGGEYCVTKAVRGSNEIVDEELRELEQRSRLYLMLGPGEKVAVSKTHPIDARHAYAVAAFCNRKTLESIQEATVRAAIQIETIEPALVASSRALGRVKEAIQEPCLLVHLDKSATEIGICHEGRLLLDYRPGVRDNPQDLVDLICTHLSRLQRHVGRQLREAPPLLQHIYLTGDKSLVDEAFPCFAGNGKFEVERIQPSSIQATWKLPKGVEDSCSIPALGSLLSTYLPSSDRDAPNFMEHILASTREPIKPFLIRSAIPFAAILLMAMSLTFVNMSSQKEIDGLQQQVDSLATAQSRARELRLKLASSESKLKELRAMASKIDSLAIGQYIARVGHCMPSDVWLNKLVISELKTVQLTGASYLEAGVFDFVTWLEQAPGFDEVALRSTQPAQSAAGPTINFNIELNFSDFNNPVEEVALNE